MTSRDSEAIRTRIDTLVTAVKARDLDAVRTVFAADIVSFDIVPPLRHTGVAAKTKNWADVFAAYDELDYELRDLTVTTGADIGFSYSLNRISGTLRTGVRTAMWVRWTGCWRRIDGEWRIVHDQVSVPAELPGGTALTGLEP